MLRTLLRRLRTRQNLSSRPTEHFTISLCNCRTGKASPFSTSGRKSKYKKMATLETLNFDNLALRSLPIDPEEENYVRQVSCACFSRVRPTPVESPAMVAYSTSAMELLDLPESEIQREDSAEYFSGNKPLKGSETAAHCYCGHQFGHFSGQLGDGAAMYLGEVVNKAGQRWEVQLKGSGLTPYSRTADGRKVLRSTIREFLCSEAMHYLGIPTTRAGTCVTSDSTVIRDIFYSGNAAAEKCSIILRIAPTFIRFGSFEIFKPTDDTTGRRGPSVGKTDILVQMLDYTVQTFYPEIWESQQENKQKAYVEFFKEVVRRTARLVADWQSVGFCHGVLNTDNMSIAGVTMDYGPYGFMDSFDPGFICNGSDNGGRYAYDQQPQICKWNCQKLAEAIKNAVPLSETLLEVELFTEEYEKHYIDLMRNKFGLLKKKEETDKDLVDSFLDVMHKTGSDFTNTFRCLSRIPLPGCEQFDSKVSEVIEYIVSQCSTLAERRLALSKPKMNPRELQMFVMILQTNPELLEQLGGAQTVVLQELERMKKLKDLQDVTEEKQGEITLGLWQDWMTGYVERLRLECEGASATDRDQVNKTRVDTMNANNPRFILRNYIAQNAIAAAEKGDYSEVSRVLKILEQPYNEDVDLADMTLTSAEGQGSSKALDDDASAAVAGGTDDTNGACAGYVNNLTYDSKPPDWALDLRVT